MDITFDPDQVHAVHKMAAHSALQSLSEMVDNFIVENIDLLIKNEGEHYSEKDYPFNKEGKAEVNLRLVFSK